MTSQYEVQLGRYIELAGLPTPEKQYLFAREFGRMYRWDFAWPQFLLAVEVDGGRFLGRGRGRTLQNAPIGYHGSVEDNRKRNLANLLGWTLLVYSPEQLKTGEAQTEIRIALEQKAGRPWRDKLQGHIQVLFASESVKRRVERVRRRIRAAARDRKPVG